MLYLNITFSRTKKLRPQRGSRARIGTGQRILAARWGVKGDNFAFKIYKSKPAGFANFY